MTTKYNIKALLIVMSAFSLIGCKKFVDVNAPVTQLVTTSVFNDNSTATAAQLAVYSQMTSDPVNIDTYTGLSGDELTTYYNNQTWQHLYANGLLIADATVINEWQRGYNYIYEENAILENFQNSNGVSAKVKQQLTGEAYFMRAYWYFYLSNLYGDVPLVLTTDYKMNTNLVRTPKVQVYQQMITDLKQAQALLNPNYVDGSDTTVTTDRARPTSWAASALMARICLYAGDITHDASYYQQAETAATTLINNSKVFSLSPLTGSLSVFKKNSSETIWQLLPPPANGFTQEASYFILLTTPPSTSSLSGCWTINPQLLNAFEVGDQRKSSWIGTTTNSGTGITYYFPYKYQIPKTAAVPAGEYSMILRLGEQYLIRAEARAQLNNLSASVSDLNVIRNRAGLPNLASNLSQSQVIAAVAHERQVELFTEGHRWFDLKRTGQVDAVMGGSTGITTAKGGTWNSNQQLYPIPLESISNSLNIKQNPGY